MKILATVKINEKKVTQAWEVIEDTEVEEMVLVVKQAENGDIDGIVLDNNLIQKIAEHGLEVAELSYSGNLDISEAELIPRAGGNR